MRLPQQSSRLGATVAALCTLACGGALGCGSALGCGGSANSPRLVTDETSQLIAVGEVPPGKPAVVHHLRRTEEASHHIVHLADREPPHVHDRTDLTVFVLHGEVVLHFADREVVTRPGDVVDIPRGTFHWAENVAKTPSTAYLVHTPPFDGTDRRVVESPKRLR